MADAQIAHVRADEHEITLVERLRWNSELIVSHGRGYLISADASLLARVQEAVARFDRNVAALRSGGLSPRGTALVAEVEGAARHFQTMQGTLFSARRASADPERLIQRFDTELRPLRAELERSVDRLVLYKEGELAQMYEKGRHARRRLAASALRSAGHPRSDQPRRRMVLRDAAGQIVPAGANGARGRSQGGQVSGPCARDRGARSSQPAQRHHMKAALMKRHATSEKARADADSIQNVAMRMEYLIKSLLDVTTMEAGRFSLTRASCDVDT